MRYLTLPTREGCVTTAAEFIDTVERTGDKTCRIHMKKPQVSHGAADKYQHEGYGASEHHNVVDVKMAAEELRAAILELEDGDHFDPLSLETLDDE
ncbi:hypothetical protein LCGC14_1805210 [marine sediment metagenome]|uniref:Uncharacterized protein n=1 Tax=marine sediment metagenome TaxID=412755 RepID=A0A0F9GNC5_9ZZZZ